MCWPGFQSTNRCFTVLLLLPFSTWTLTCFPVKNNLYIVIFTLTQHTGPANSCAFPKLHLFKSRHRRQLPSPLQELKPSTSSPVPHSPYCEIIRRHVHTHTYAFMHANSFSLCNRLNNDLLPCGYLSFANVRQCFLSGNELMNDGWMQQHMKCLTIFFPFYSSSLLSNIYCIYAM